MGAQLVVHNLPWSVSSERLMDFFSEFNAVDAEIQYDDVGRSRSLNSLSRLKSEKECCHRGYGVVKFEQQEDAEKAISSTHMTDLDGRTVMVRFDRYG